MRWFQLHSALCLSPPLLGDDPQVLSRVSVLCLAILAALVAGFVVGFVLRRLSDSGEDRP